MDVPNTPFRWRAFPGLVALFASAGCAHVVATPLAAAVEPPQHAAADEPAPSWVTVAPDGFRFQCEMPGEPLLHAGTQFAADGRPLRSLEGSIDMGPATFALLVFEGTQPLAEVERSRQVDAIGQAIVDASSGTLLAARDLDGQHYGRVFAMSLPESRAVGFTQVLGGSAGVYALMTVVPSDSMRSYEGLITRFFRSAALEDAPIADAVDEGERLGPVPFQGGPWTITDNAVGRVRAGLGK